MSVDRKEVERIAALAHLRLGDREAERLTGELNDILEHVAVLRGLAAASAAAVSLPSEGSSTRPSEEAAPDELHVAPPAFAPRWADGFFVVPPPPGVHADEGG